jgi:hypothetical protein
MNWRIGPPDESSARPAEETLRAIRPGLTTLRGRLVAITTPYMRSGPVWQAYTKHYGVDASPVLVWRAPSIVMNPLLDEAMIADAVARDPEAAKSEWLAEFRDDASALVTDAALRRVVRIEEPADIPAFEGPPLVFVDVASGSGSDSFTAGVAVRTRDSRGQTVSYVLDVGESRPPFDPAKEVASLSDACKSLGVSKVFGDRFAAGWTNSAPPPGA